MRPTQLTAEQQRLLEHRQRRANWRHWGPYISERAWGTVREDYSSSGDAWQHFSFEHAHRRAYRWNEDGLAGICDRHQYLCFAVALWIFPCATCSGSFDALLGLVLCFSRFLAAFAP